MACDLAEKHDVTSVDVSRDSLSLVRNKKINRVQADISDSKWLQHFVTNYDIVVSAVPGFMGFKTLKTIITAGKNFVDISFLPEDTLQLNELAVKNNVTGITDMGVAPGMPNLIAGYYYNRMKIQSFEYMVGGLPEERTFPFEYKAPFSPVDVIEEYTRPARYKENGYILTKPAMSDPELLDFGGIGTLEAFNTDGLRSLLYTLKDIPNMKEKTLRYPGHIRLVKAFMETGFFSMKKVNIKGQEVSPFDLTTHLLFQKWKLRPEEPEFTVMRVRIKGSKGKSEKEIVYDLLDRYDDKKKISSMARTTGFTGTAGVELILEKKFTKKGVHPPELVGSDETCFSFVLDYLKERNVIYRKTEK